MDKAKSKQVLLFYCVESEDLSRKVAASSDSIKLQSINWRSFDDGFPNLFINNAQDTRSQHVASSSSSCVIFEQLSVIFALPREIMCNDVTILLSNITYIGHIGKVFFGDHVLPYFETRIPLLKQRLHQLIDEDNASIAFPDDGEWKRYHKQFQNFPLIVCTKVREGNKRIVRLQEGSPIGGHVVIVDDLVQSVGTLIECQKVLAAHGAAKVSAYVTHGVFPKKSWERFMHKDEGSFF